MSLKTEIETTIAAAIEAVVGAGSPDADPYMPLDELIGNIKYGAYPMDSEFTQGPLVRVVIDSHATQEEEFGTPDNRVSILVFGISIAGLTGLHEDPAAAASAASDTEEIIRLHLQNLAFNIDTSYGEGRNSYATELQYRGSSFETGTISGRQTSPIVESPVPVAGNSGAIALHVNADQAYSGLNSAVITVEVVTPNTTAGHAAGLTIRYKIDNGSFSAALPVGRTFVPLANNVFVSVNPTGVAQTGDKWTIQARTSQLYALGMWVQSWIMVAEATAVY